MSGWTVLLKPDSKLDYAESKISYCLETLKIVKGVYIQLDVRDPVQEVMGRNSLWTSTAGVRRSVMFCRRMPSGRACCCDAAACTDQGGQLCFLNCKADKTVKAE